MQPKILIASTTWWAMPARLALAFLQSGSQVSAICPRGSPISKIGALREEYRFGSVDPLASLLHAIRSAEPDLIVPCDDRVVGHLHRLHAGEMPAHDLAAVRELIETSLGLPAGYRAASSRSAFLQIAREIGIRVPDTAVVRNQDDVRAWVTSHGYPVVLKADGTWGGSGVRIARTWAEAECAYKELRRPVSASSVLSHLSFHDFFPLFALDQELHRELTVQSYVAGQCGNAMFACWSGEVVDSLSVEVLFSEKELGASSIVRTISDPEMECVGDEIVRKFGISGFCGLDFIKEQESGKLFLIEFNPRATQLGHLQPGGRDSLAKVLVRELLGRPRAEQQAVVHETIAFFPRPRNDIRDYGQVYRDVPWEEPALVRELKRKAWNARHLSAFAYIAGRKLFRLIAGSKTEPEEQVRSSEVKFSDP